ncbi:zinc metalloprotease [Gemmatimonadetes bacterium T265]|nr:zinc metalloprotease [Gemmatimonadetes bacterium T265]
MLAFLAPLLVFGLVVFVHELGHFVAAKLTGVYAPRFSIGFGPALLKKRVGETEYVLAALPLGGYVRMASREDDAVAFLEGGGEHPAGTVPTTGGNAAGRAADDHTGDPHRNRDWDPNALAPFGPRPVPSHRWFESKPLPARLFILLAGVTMNIALAFVVYAGNFAVRGRPYVPPVIDSVVAGRPAALAGLRAGDSVTAIDGRPIRTWAELVARVSPTPPTALTLDVHRATGLARVRLTPVLAESPDPATGAPRTVGQIGAYVRPTIIREPVGLGTAVREGAVTTWENATSVLGVLRGLFGGKVAVSNLGGPIAIARTSVAAARAGFESLLLLVAFLSVNIAVLNLLPVPVLDGGQVLINVLEALKGRAFSVRVREQILRLGLAAVALLFVTVMWNDLSRLVGDWLR